MSSGKFRYNTAIRSQTTSFFSQIKGGEVDRAFAIRELAAELNSLLQSTAEIQQLRQKHADPDSLVPVGSRSKVGFAPTPTTAQEWMAEQQRKDRQPKSNVLKSDSSFGGGFHTTQGKKVIAAAYSLEEMMQRAREEEEKKMKKYFDDPEKARQWREKHGVSSSTTSSRYGNGGSSGLSGSSGIRSEQQQTNDLLDLNAFTDSNEPAGGDLLGLDTVDLLSGTETAMTQQSAVGVVDLLGDLLPAAAPVGGGASVLLSPSLVASTPLVGGADRTSVFVMGAAASSTVTSRRPVMGGSNRSTAASVISSLDSLDLNSKPPDKIVTSAPIAPAPFAPPPPPPLEESEASISSPHELSIGSITSSSLSSPAPSVPLVHNTPMMQLYLQQQQQLMMMQQQVLMMGNSGMNTQQQVELMKMMQQQQQQLMKMMTMASGGGSTAPSSMMPSTEAMGGSSDSKANFGHDIFFGTK